MNLKESLQILIKREKLKLFVADKSRRPKVKGSWLDPKNWLDNLSDLKASGSRFFGVPCAYQNLIVVDVDHKNGKKNGIENFKLFLKSNNYHLPKTLTVETQTGGRHYYFRLPSGTDWKSLEFRKQIVDDVDLKFKGYVLAPNGAEYKIIDDHEIATAPDWLMEFSRERETLPDELIDDKYKGFKVAKLTNEELIYGLAKANIIIDAFMRNSEKSLQHGTGHGNNDTIELIDALLDYLPPGEVETLINNINKGDKGDTSGELTPESIHKKILSRLALVSSRSQAAGQKSVGLTIRDIIPEIEFDAIENEESFIFGADEFGIFDTKFRYEVVLPFFASYGDLTIISSRGGIGKSALSLYLGVMVATGENFDDLPFISNDELNGGQRVWLANIEDDAARTRQRLQALFKGVWGDELPAEIKEKIRRNMFFSSTDELNMFSLIKSDKSGYKVDYAVVNRLLDSLVRNEIKIVFFDPLKYLHTANENDNGAMGELSKILRYIAKEANCAIISIHHAAKNAKGKKTIDLARGASALIDNARRAYVLESLTKKEAAALGINSKDYFKLSCVKDNYEPITLENVLFERVSVNIGKYENKNKEISSFYLKCRGIMKDVDPADEVFIFDEFFEDFKEFSEEYVANNEMVLIFELFEAFVDSLIESEKLDESEKETQMALIKKRKAKQEYKNRLLSIFEGAKIGRRKKDGVDFRNVLITE